MSEQVKQKKGTTTVGLVCKDGVVLAADKRASMGWLIANKDVEKIFPISNFIALTLAGSVSDALNISKILKAELDLYRLNSSVEPSLTVAASLAGNAIFSGYKSYSPYMVQLILGGLDDHDTFAIYDVDPSGAVLRNTKYTTTGSGSPMVYGVLEDSYKENMSVDEGVQLAIRCVSAAMRRDVFSGEGIDVIVIDKKGLRRIEKEKIASIIKARY
ncbi:MAG: archaeal proteasome endopeptidase complex subunit beta [DPANN group archaeon]|nr:archaeal proteasome endopeptidase complex subunit beta [DPANN group archaeon]